MEIEDINITEQEIKDDERIDAYLRGEMDAEEEQKFIEELKANPELKEKAIAVARMIKGMKTAGYKRDQEAINVLRSMKKEDVKQMARKIISEDYSKKYNVTFNELLCFAKNKLLDSAKNEDAPLNAIKGYEDNALHDITLFFSENLLEHIDIISSIIELQSHKYILQLTGAYNKLVFLELNSLNGKKHIIDHRDEFVNLTAKAAIKIAAREAIMTMMANEAKEEYARGRVLACKRQWDRMNAFEDTSMTIAHPWWIMSFAAVCLAFIIFGGIKYVDYRNTQQLAETYAVYITNMHEKTYTMGESDEKTTKEQLAILFDKIKNDSVDDATISKLEELWKQSQSQTFNDYTNYSSEIGYALAIAYLRDGDKKKTKEILNSIQNTTKGELRITINKMIKESWLK